MSQSLLIISRQSPWSGPSAREALDIALAGGAFDLPVGMLFLDDGAFQLAPGQHPAHLQQKDLQANLQALPMFGVDDLYVSARSLRERGLAEERLALAVEVLDDQALRDLLQRLSTQPFFSEHAHLSAMVAGATILCFSFLGFDAVTTLSEETRDAGRVIPRAIFLTALYGGVIFITVSYFLQSYFPTNVRFKEPDAALPEIALYVGGKLFQSIFLCATFINTLASGLASQASVSRLLYVMGRDNVLPERIFGFVHPKWRTPSINVLIVGMVALSAISFDLVTATALINFGALVAFTFVNLSVIVHFYVRGGRNRSLKEHFHYLVLPLLGAAIVAVLWLNLESTSLVMGLIWAGLGFGYLFYLTRSFSRPPPRFQESELSPTQ